MKIFAIEDEPLAMQRLKDLLVQTGIKHEVIGEADSIETAIAFLRNGQSPDLIITDVQLADGLCFGIFKIFQPQCPVIFTTAYHHHAIEAFKVNAIDYLLKPVKVEELKVAVTKASMLIHHSAIDYTQLAKAIIAEEQKYSRRYLIRFADQIRSIESDDIAYIYTTHKSVFLVTHAGKSLPIDKSLDTLEKELDPKLFFRINRQFIVNVKSILTMHPASKSRVQIELNPIYKEDEVIVSTEKSPLFKAWLGYE